MLAPALIRLQNNPPDLTDFQLQFINSINSCLGISKQEILTQGYRFVIRNKE